MTQHKKYKIVVEWLAVKLDYTTYMLLGALSLITFSGWLYSQEQNISLQLLYFSMGPLLMCFFFYLAIIHIELEEEKWKIAKKKEETKRMYEPKVGDNVVIKKHYCADNVYVGLSGEVVEVFKQTLGDFAVRIKVKLPTKDKKYYLGDIPIFPVFCIEKTDD